ncbi:hypothetical protein CO038_02425 [Candidatus Pacearchaeota archaeon CG_4_9_14_0_2_um_filter_39_13]|nr:MAG: hypothetical protein CO038_02425 [Candidatus Pacearchaeota archaeon CG_4_9_14_0_2_um_filter_39_13]
MRQIFLVILGLILLSAFVNADAVFVQHGTADFSDYYRAEGRLSTYYPILGKDPESCLAREDILLQVAPAGCQPTVVRSDLLAEQNVPVFCQLDAIKINPLLDIEQIRNIRFSVADRSEGVVGVGFHPARAALRTNDILLGSPVEDNVGYAVVVLKREPVEENLPDSVRVNLTATMDYYAGNSFGVGKSEFLLQELSDDKWDTERSRQSFFRGQYSVRLIDAEPERARIAIYEGDRKVQEVVVDRREGGRVFLPGGYCGVDMDVSYDGFVAADKTALLNVDGDNIEVYRGSRFLNNKCVVREIELSGKREGKIGIACGNERFELSLRPTNYDIGEEVLFINGTEGHEKYGKEYKFWTVKLVGENVTITRDGQDLEVLPGWIKPVDSDKLYEAEYNVTIEEYFGKTIDSYEALADEIPFDKASGANESYAEKGLLRAIDLAGNLGKKATEERLLDKFEDLYPLSYNENNLEMRRQEVYNVDSSEAVRVVNIDSGFKAIRLVELNEPELKSKATFSLGQQRIEIEDKDDYNFTSSVGNGSFTLEKIEVSSVVLSGYCNGEREVRSRRLGIVDLRDESLTLCGQVLVLEAVDLKQFAKIRFNSDTKSFTETNLTVNIGIEKRAFQLSPDKAQEKIDNLNETIEKWQSISENLGEAVKGMKAACFATSGVLTIKNFFSGLSGEAIARERVMRGSGGWTEICEAEAKQKGISVDRCFSDHSSDINKDVREMTERINADNEVLQRLTDDNTDDNDLGGIFKTQSVDSGAIRDGFIGSYNNQLLQEKIKFSDGREVGVGELVNAEDNDGNRYLSVTEARDMKLWLDIRNSNDFSQPTKDRAEKELQRIGQGIYDKKQSYTPIEGLPESQQGGGLAGKQVGIYGNKDAIQGEYYGGFVSNGEYGLSDLEGGSAPAQLVTYDGKPYLVLLGKASDNSYVPTKVYEWNNGVAGEDVSEDLGGKFRNFQKIDANAYRKKINNPEVKYYESEPYRGMPAIVPFDVENGWYAATQQSLPGFGNIKAFESSGRVASFWLCHVGIDGNMDFLSSGFGGDKCTQFNLNNGQALDKFPGLSEAETRRKVDEAVQALNDAASQYGKGSRVSILGQSLKVGLPASSVPGTQCQDFMSPDDCKLLFNVCDPVICPTSRCDFGGTYPVDNVVQSGIIGSALLCLPNSVAFGGDVIVPVCLSGIHAGVDSYLSILEQHKACLEENIASGETVGICDEITSVYTCEFFWRQAAPLTKALLPKIVEFIYSGGRAQARGGGEYMAVQSAFDNTQGSIDYFTKYYAGNTFEAFRARSIDEAGGEFCRAFVSAKAPTDFDALIEPDSPPQFHAFFSEIPFSDATVPATSQYKVFYHIFSGNDRGVSYMVYLKDPPETSYYNSNPTIQVASGFVGRGQSVSETKDFTTPAGYKQLCVRINGDEECGFKQVSTSFALNYLRDEAVKGELTRTDISSERECISGSVNPSALFNPNIQEAGQEAIDPAVYNRGIVRVCSTDNPGTGTNPTRFVDVGYCGNERVRCWIDKESVDNALTPDNLGAKEDTLEKLQGRAEEVLEDGSDFLIGDKASNAFKEVDSDFRDRLSDSNDLVWGGEFNENEVGALIDRIDTLIDKTYLSVDRAKLMFLKGEVYESVTMHLFKSGGHTVNAEKPGEHEVPAECVVPEDCEIKYGAGDYICEEGLCKSLAGTQEDAPVQETLNGCNPSVSICSIEDDLSLFSIKNGYLNYNNFEWRIFFEDTVIYYISESGTKHNIGNYNEDPGRILMNPTRINALIADERLSVSDRRYLENIKSRGLMINLLNYNEMVSRESLFSLSPGNVIYYNDKPTRYYLETSLSGNSFEIRENVLFVGEVTVGSISDIPFEDLPEGAKVGNIFLNEKAKESEDYQILTDLSQNNYFDFASRRFLKSGTGFSGGTQEIPEEPELPEEPESVPAGYNIKHKDGRDYLYFGAEGTNIYFTNRPSESVQVHVLSGSIDKEIGEIPDIDLQFGEFPKGEVRIYSTVNLDSLGVDGKTLDYIRDIDGKPFTDFLSNLGSYRKSPYEARVSGNTFIIFASQGFTADMFIKGDKFFEEDLFIHDEIGEFKDSIILLDSEKCLNSGPKSTRYCDELDNAKVLGRMIFVRN